MNETVTIRWLGHSCFRMEYREYPIVIDPYEDGYVPGLAPLCTSAGAIYCSHGHGDHSAAACVKQIRVKAPNDISVQEFAVPHDHFCTAFVANHVTFLVRHITSAALFCRTFHKLHKSRIKRTDKLLPLLLAVRNFV